MRRVTDSFKMTKVIHQACGDCLIRIEAWKPYEGDEGFVDVQVISNNASAQHMFLKSRIKNAWSVLRGSYDWSGFEMLTQDESVAVISALQEAEREAFPAPPGAMVELSA